MGLRDRELVCKYVLVRRRSYTTARNHNWRHALFTEFLDFTVYDWALYHSNAVLGEVELARWLGVSHRVGRLTSYWILPSSGIPISATTVQRLTYDERNTEETKKQVEDYEEKLRRVLEVQLAVITSGLIGADPYVGMQLALVRRVNVNYFTQPYEDESMTTRGNRLVFHIRIRSWTQWTQGNVRLSASIDRLRN